MTAVAKRLVLEGDPSIEVHLKRSRRTRRLSLRVSQLDGRVTLSLPAKLTEDVARAFLVEKADWVRKHLNAQPDACLVEPGAQIPVLGRSTTIVSGPGKRPELCNGTLRVSAARPVAPQVIALLKTLARERLVSACDHYAARIGVRYNRLTLRDTRSRWGSCTSEGNLMFTWRLAMAAPEVLDYVAAHEVAHLVEMNHGPDFWKLVASVCPEFKRHRTWLREHGAHLHRIRFDLSAEGQGS